AAEANLGERDEAERHARQSVQMQPNELAFTVLGDIAFDRGDVDGAKRSWFAAYDLGDRDDGLIERLRQAGVADPAHARR
ncbi:MAG TPA: hypothetical protein VG841_07040, partial [Caulobacterales bacterium]|nr:hypothetical protein [Caulobacterales bacterium]